MKKFLYAVISLMLVGSLMAQSRIDISDSNKNLSVAATDAKYEWLSDGLCVTDSRAGKLKEKQWVGVEIENKSGVWDFNKHTEMLVDLTNPGKEQVSVFVRIEDSKTKANVRIYRFMCIVGPGETQTLKMWLYRRTEKKNDFVNKLFGDLNGLPGGYAWHWQVADLETIKRIRFSFRRGKAGQQIIVSNIRGTGEFQLPDAKMLEGFFPFIDRYGQYKWLDWPGKIKSNSELKESVETQREDLEANPGSNDWDEFGGWENGPRFKATGFFYTKKYKEQWWLVDPEGYLFWSTGITCIDLSGGRTQLEGVEKYFDELPDSNIVKKAYSKHGGKGQVNLQIWNLYRKYGPNWEKHWYQLIHKRLRSWGINTIANWSSWKLCFQRKTPYVLAIGYNKKLIPGTRVIPDVFEPSFKKNIFEAMARQKDCPLMISGVSVILSTTKWAGEPT